MRLYNYVFGKTSDVRTGDRGSLIQTESLDDEGEGTRPRYEEVDPRTTSSSSRPSVVNQTIQSRTDTEIPLERNLGYQEITRSLTTTAP